MFYDDSSSEDSREAVATLMSVCGISVNMNYSPMESGQEIHTRVSRF